MSVRRIPLAHLLDGPYKNAMRIFQYDPFSVIPKEQCTVGALRAEVEGHDVSTRSYDTGRFEKSAPDLMDLQARATA